MPRRSPRLAAAAAALGLAAAGCGSDEEERKGASPSPPRTDTTATEPRATAPSATAPPREVEPGDGERRQSPEAQPGGAGDEEAARSPAQLTGRGGRITPRRVQVPPFLAVQVTLRSADGREYALRFGSRVLRTRRSASLDLDGLRPGERAVGRPPGGGPPVVIEASAEPGP